MPEEPKPMIPMSEMYRYRDGTDTACLVIGAIAAAANGCSIPAFSEIWGRLLNALSKTTNRQEVGEEVAKWAAIMTYVGVGVFVCSVMEVGLYMYSAERQIHRIRAKYLAAALAQDMAWFDENTPGEIGARLAGDTKVMQKGMGEKVANMVHNTSATIAGIIFGFMTSWRLTLVVLSIMPLLAGAGMAMGLMLTKLTSDAQASYSKAGNYATQAIENIRTVHASNAVPFELDRFNKSVAQARKDGTRKHFVTNATTGTVYFISFGSYALAFWYASTLVRDGHNNVGEIVACFFAVLISSFSLGMIAAPMGDIASARGAAKQIFDTIERVPGIDIHTKGKILPDLKGDITFKGVKFVYPTRKEMLILDKFNLAIPAGQSAAFVGASGCGKSSIVGLVQRLYDPVEGEILVDGVPLKELDVTWWRNQVGVVSQEPSLFSGTVMSNVKAGNTSVTDEDVVKACKDAFIHETITTLPNGYETDIGSLGSQLSGGQKQRIAIARALVKKPKVLLLDEATSALDRRSEIKVQQAIDKLLSGCRTTIVVAHRLVTIKDCNVIHVMERKEVPSAEPYAAESSMHTIITESGTFDHLVALKGKFASLVKAQVRTNERASSDVAEQDVKTILENITPPVSPRDAKKGEEKGGKDEGVPFKRLLMMNKPEWWAIAVGSMGSLLGGAVYPFYGVVFSEMITVLGQKQGKDLDTDGPFWAMMFLVIAGGSLVAWTIQGFMGYAGEGLTERLRQQLLRALLNNEIAFFDQPGHEPGSLGVVLSGDTEAIHSLLGPSVSIKMSSLSTLACAFGISFYYCWKLALVCLCVVPALALAGLANMAMIGGHDQGDSDMIEAAGKVAHEATSNIRTVLAFNMHSDLDARYGTLTKKRAKEGKKNAIVSGIMFGFGQFVMFAAFALSFWYGGKLISDGEEDFNSVMIASMSIMMASMGIGETSAMMVTYKDAEGAARRVFRHIDRAPLMNINDHSAPATGSSSDDIDIEFKNVFFSYPTRPTATVLKDLTLRFPAKKHIAMIGSTGCGKSTVMQLLLRFYDPSAGTIKVRGHDLSSVGLHWWRSQLAIVSQEPCLFEGSIADNISYGLEVVTPADIEQAARLASLHDDVMSMPDKYDTEVGPRGSKLSGGQKQRVAIARAIVRKPKVLLLDEATSALDNKSEAEVQKAIDNIIAQLGMTVVTIAHRLTTIEGADEIAVLDAGVVVEKGTHRELLDLKGDYAVRYEQYHEATVREAAAGVAVHKVS